MVIALLVAVALMGWAIAAASYASDVEGFQKPDVPLARVGMIVWLVGGLAHFLWNAVVQIPNAHRVAAHTVTQHPVLLLLIALSAVGVGLFGWLMSRLERQFAKEDERFRRMSENG
jgi:cytochrome bd-type quinol oxidase subunit 2